MFIGESVLLGFDGSFLSSGASVTSDYLSSWGFDADATASNCHRSAASSVSHLTLLSRIRTADGRWHKQPTGNRIPSRSHTVRRCRGRTGGVPHRAAAHRDASHAISQHTVANSQRVDPLGIDERRRVAAAAAIVKTACDRNIVAVDAIDNPLPTAVAKVHKIEAIDVHMALVVDLDSSFQLPLHSSQSNGSVTTCATIPMSRKLPAPSGCPPRKWHAQHRIRNIGTPDPRAG